MCLIKFLCKLHWPKPKYFCTTLPTLITFISDLDLARVIPLAAMVVWRWYSYSVSNNTCVLMSLFLCLNVKNIDGFFEWYYSICNKNFWLILLNFRDFLVSNFGSMFVPHNLNHIELDGFAFKFIWHKLFPFFFFSSNFKLYYWVM